MKNSVLVGFKRSPFTLARKGELSEVRPEDILSQVIITLLFFNSFFNNSKRLFEISK